MYPTDPKVEVQIRILLKDKYVKSCQKCEHRQSHFDFPNTDSKKIYLGFFIKDKQLASQVVFLVKSKHWVLAEIQFFVCLCFFKQDFCSKVLFLANPDCVHALFLVIL
jgi:hypothetical protein